ncbi:MAG: sensor histidine kinase [Phycisphaerae bacterium]
MRRHRYIWPVFALCLLIVFVAMGWVSLLALDLERTRIEADQQTRHQQKVRLALWRLDSAAQPLILQESARPHYVYQAFYPARVAYTRTYAQIARDEVLIPSHLLFFESPWIRLHFQIEPDGQITSPEVPTGNGRDEVERRYDLGPRIVASARRLEELTAVLRAETLSGRLPQAVPDPVPDSLATYQPDRRSGGRDYEDPPQAQQAQSEQRPQGKGLSRSEYDARMWASNNNLQIREPMGLESAGPARGPFRRLWVGPVLVMARRVKFAQAEVVQGCWLDWDNLKPWLLSQIGDLLPDADLRPIVTGQDAPADEGTQLASLPVQLLSGPIAAADIQHWSAVRYALLVAWICVILGSTAVGIVLAQAVSLSRRRGAFVSAVTHEMRTPLTTFRLYSDMLADGMIRDPDKRAGYLHRLRDQADRLSHLVENVLAFARLTGPRRRAQLETVEAEQLVDQVRERLESRLGQAGLQLEVDSCVGGQIALADVSAVEQILLNLVDNACKYASGPEGCPVRLRARSVDGWIELAVEDRGKGVPAGQRKQIFRPFGKSAQQAAHSAPGIGLGLALSRRLARNMGGELLLDEKHKPGARFVLRLKRQQP